MRTLIATSVAGWLMWFDCDVAINVLAFDVVDSEQTSAMTSWISARLNFKGCCSLA